MTAEGPRVRSIPGPRPQAAAPLACLRLQHEAEPLPEGAAGKLPDLYGLDWRDRLGFAEGTWPSPADLLLHDVARVLPGTHLLVGAAPGDRAALQDRIAAWGLAARVEVVPVPAPASLWARDPGVALADGTVLVPSAFRPDDADPAHAGAAAALEAVATVGQARLRRSAHLLEGGDLLATATRAYVGELTLARNEVLAGVDRDRVLAGLAAELGVALQALPSYAYHLDLFVAFPLPGLAILADPAAGIAIARQALAASPMPAWARGELAGMVAETEARDLAPLAEVRRILEADGLRVVGLPFLHGVGDDRPDHAGPRTALASFANGLFVQEGDRPVAVLGSSGHGALDAVAEAAYVELGFTVRFVPAAAISTMQLGGVRCATLELP